MADDYETDETAALVAQPRRDNQIARQDFAGTSLATQNGSIEAMVAKSRAEVESACVMAKRWPRNPDQVRQDLIAECKRPGFAAVAIYRLPRGDKTVEGLTIRFAEVAMRCMTNMEVSSETINDDAAVRQIRVQVIDYERNSRWRTDVTISKTVERKFLKRGQRPLGERVNSYGDRVYIVEATEDDVRSKQNSEISKAARTGILRIIPGHLQDEARAVCREIASKADAKDPAAARNKMFDAFASIGVTAAALEQWLGHSTDTISPAEREDLLGLHAAIKEGETTWGEVLREALESRAERADAKADKTPPRSEVKPTTPDTAAPVTKPAATSTSSTGKGTAALKAAVAKTTPQPAKTQTARPLIDLPPGMPSPEEGAEYRACAKCAAIIEVPISDPPGGKCGDCSASEREE